MKKILLIITIILVIVGVMYFVNYNEKDEFVGVWYEGNEEVGFYLILEEKGKLKMVTTNGREDHVYGMKEGYWSRTKNRLTLKIGSNEEITYTYSVRTRETLDGDYNYRLLDLEAMGGKENFFYLLEEVNPEYLNNMDFLQPYLTK
jgi:hypothetical protein